MKSKNVGVIVRGAVPWIVAGALAIGVGYTTTTRASTAAVAPPKVDHILLEVSDLKASEAFYRDLIGLQVKSEHGDFVTLEAENIGVFLWSKRWKWETPRTPGERQGLGMYPHFVVGDVKGAVERARAAGYKILQDAKWHPYGTEAFVADPDGYVWALISRGE